MSSIGRNANGGTREDRPCRAKHSLLRTIYEKLKAYDLCTLCDERYFLAIRIVCLDSDTMAGFSPTALLFGVHPRASGGTFDRTMATHAHLIHERAKHATKMNSIRRQKAAAQRRHSKNMKVVRIGSEV